MESKNDTRGSILATGAGGTVGSYLDARFVGLTRADLDVTDFESVRDAFQKVQPAGVLHLAAATNVDNCETESEMTFQTNALGSLNVARACAELDVPLIYISSAQVFSGDKHTAYHEFDMPNPRTVYGASKLAGENAVLRAHSRSIVVRVGWMIGGGRAGERKFISKMLERGMEDGVVRAVNDKFGSLTYARDLVELSPRLISSGFHGVVHYGSPDSASRFEIAQRVISTLDIALPVRAVSSDAFDLPAPRGRSEFLSSLVLPTLGLVTPGDWRSTLDEYLFSEWT